LLTVPSATAPRVSVVVVTAKQPGRLVECLRAVAREAPPDVPLEVVVVLNGAEPQLRDVLEGELDGVRVVASDVQLGFAGGLNLGVRHTRGELVQVLHDDAIVEPGWLEALLAALDRDPVAGAAGSVLLDDDGTVQAAGWVLWQDGNTRPPWADGPPSVAELLEQPFAVDYCGSASLLVRREAWYAAAGADEELHPAYYVDVDLAMALRAQAWTVVCAPASRVRHTRGGSASVEFRRFLVERNRARFLAKWGPDLVHQAERGADRDALERARAATRRRAEALATAARPSNPRPATNDADETRRERALLRDAAVKDDYIAHLERLPGLDELASTRAELEATRAAHAAARERLELIEGGRWWRLRGRLLAARGRLSRLAGTSRTG
jgi:GT2 family glycosyltransferase